MQSAHKGESEREKEDAKKKMRDKVHTPVLWDWNWRGNKNLLLEGKDHLEIQ